MLQTPTAESKERSQAGPTVAEPTPQVGLHPNTGMSSSLTATGFRAGQPRPDPAVLPRNIGNRAMLRMLHRPTPAVLPTAAPPIQCKLEIGAVNDPLEAEADRVMRMPDPEIAIGSATPQISRKCAACEEEDEKKLVQRKPTGEARSAGDAPPLVHDVLRSPGRSLDAATRAFMEPRFGADFSRVRVHDGAQATESAKSVRALAYTVGNNVVFNTNQYQPASIAGQRLLAHELAHVVQQSGGATLRRRMGPPGPDDPDPNAPVAKKAVTGTNSKDQAYVVYETEIREGGTRPWRNNNPGNFDKPSDHPKNIGTDGRFLIFPDADTGKQELIDSIAAHGTSSIRTFISAHAPPSENDTEQYIKDVLSFMNNGSAIGECQITKPAKPVSGGTVIGNLNDADQASLAMAMARKEGWCDVTQTKATYNCQSASIPDEYKGKLACP